MNFMKELSQKRGTAAEKLAELRRQRGGDVLDGKKPDTAQIDALVHEVDALDEAEAERVRREREEVQEEYENRIEELLDKFEIPDFDSFLVRYLNNKPEPWYEEDKDTGREHQVRPGRKEYLDFVWGYLEKDEINYEQLKDFALKQRKNHLIFLIIKELCRYKETLISASL